MSLWGHHSLSFSYNSTYTAVGLGKDDHRAFLYRPVASIFFGDEEGQIILVASIVIAVLIKTQTNLWGPRLLRGRIEGYETPYRFFEAWHADWLQQGWSKWTVEYKDGGSCWSKNGTAIEYYEDGSKYKQIPYVDGKPHGTAVKYYGDGSRRWVETPYVDGKQHGTVNRYY